MCHWYNSAFCKNNKSWWTSKQVVLNFVPKVQHLCWRWHAVSKHSHLKGMSFQVPSDGKSFHMGSVLSAIKTKTQKTTNNEKNSGDWKGEAKQDVPQLEPARSQTPPGMQEDTEIHMKKYNTIWFLSNKMSFPYKEYIYSYSELVCVSTRCTYLCVCECVCV